ncbi:MAG: hypothetical protein BZY87_05815 [SAR202 cluster bacterium Io17-Chloro-G6]|nr:MAG: hypothetical protein BZY87_05815 [SAR202 cluster bacterium Io17-Chloro-G6]
MPEGLTFIINPETQSASLDLFLRALGDINRLLRDVNYAIHRERSGRHWVISHLHTSSPTVTIESLLGDQESVSTIANGIRTVTLGTDQPPEYFTEQVLEDLRRMRRLFRGRDRAHSIIVSVDNEETATIREDISDKASRILTSGYSNLGSLEGRLEAISVHGSPTFTIWDRVSQAPVRCSFPNQTSWIQDVKDLLGNRVMVRGYIRYFLNGIPRTISDIAEIHDSTPDPNLPKADFGSIPDQEAARDPVKFLRSIRGLEQE